MSYHYNETFENPDYYFAETLEVDRSYQGEHRGRRQDYPLAIPMTSLRHNFEYSESLPRVEVLSRSPYGRSQDNLSFEPELELAYSPCSAFSPLDDPYSHRFSGASEDGFVRRRNRGPSDNTTFSTLSQATPARREEEKLVGSLASMSRRARIKAIQKMPETMKRKREIRNKVLKEITKKSGGRRTQCGCCTHCLHRARVSFRRFRNILSEYFHRLNFWHKTLKVIGEEFGTSVLSYFIFLRWLLHFNIFSFLVNFGFIAIPQFVTAEPNNLSFTGLELLTGAGYFQQTVLYYGFYTNATIRQMENGLSYNMQLAYIFTVGIYFVICLLLLMFSMAKSFCRNIINPRAFSGDACKLLCTWDFNITNEKAVKLKQKNLSIEIKEDLAKENQEALHFSITESIFRILIHLGSWAACLGTAVAVCAGVYFFSINNLELFMKGYRSDLESQAAMLVLPIITSLLNVFIPFFYSWLGNLEKFRNPKSRIYVAITRTIILKISIIGVLCYYWLNVVAASESQCWETLVGQDIYRFVLVDFIFCLLGSFFGEFLRRIIGTTVCVSLGVPEFDIGRSVLDLIYAQTLTWIGILFSPLLPGIQMVSFSIVFYVKKVSLMRNCQPPRKAWRAAQMTTVFMFLLLFPSLTGVVAVIAVTVWRLKPSKECGPFRGLPSIYAAISEWVKMLENYADSKWVAWIYYNLITNELFFFILSALVLIIAYFYRQIIKGRRDMSELLIEQIINGGKDKRFLLQNLQMLRGTLNPFAPRRPDQQRSSSSDCSSMPPAQQEPNYPGRTSDRNQTAFYSEYPYSPGILWYPYSPGFLWGTGFPSDWETSQPCSSSGMSEAVALALRARQAAQWEDLNDIDFQP